MDERIKVETTKGFLDQLQGKLCNFHTQQKYILTSAMELYFYNSVFF